MYGQHSKPSQTVRPSTEDRSASLVGGMKEALELAKVRVVIKLASPKEGLWDVYHVPVERDHILPWRDLRAQFREVDAGKTMYRYGRSKTMHWDHACARPNTLREPLAITLRDGYEAGCLICDNCYGRDKNSNIWRNRDRDGLRKEQREWDQRLANASTTG